MTVARRTRNKPVFPGRETDTRLPDGRRLVEGVEFSIRGGGRYRFAYAENGAVTAFGPIGRLTGPAPKWRSFAPDAVKTIHRDRTETR